MVKCYMCGGEFEASAEVAERVAMADHYDPTEFVCPECEQDERDYLETLEAREVEWWQSLSYAVR